MARLQVRTDTNQMVASRDIPDAIIPYAQDIFGGATNAETAALFLDWLWDRAKNHIRNEVREAAAAAAVQAVTDARAAKEAEFDAAIG